MADKKPRVAKDPAQLAKALTIALWGIGGVEIIVAIAKIAELLTLSSYDARQPWTSWRELPRSGLQELIVPGSTWLVAAAALVTTFLWLKWTYRANLNAIVLAPDKQVSPAWAIGWYVVPLANLLMPFRAMRETWQISQFPKAWRTAPTPALLRWWWGVSLFVSWVRIGSPEVETVGGQTLLDYLHLANSCLTLSWTLLTMTMVRRITDLQMTSLELGAPQRRKATPSGSYRA